MTHNNHNNDGRERKDEPTLSSHTLLFNIRKNLKFIVNGMQRVFDEYIFIELLFALLDLFCGINVFTSELPTFVHFITGQKYQSGDRGIHLGKN